MFSMNDFLVEKDNTAQRNEISAVNDTLAPQPTKASRLWGKDLIVINVFRKILS